MVHEVPGNTALLFKSSDLELSGPRWDMSHSPFLSKVRPLDGRGLWGRLSEPSWFRVQCPSPGDTTSPTCLLSEGNGEALWPVSQESECSPASPPAQGPAASSSLLVEYRLCLGATLCFAVSFAGKVVVYRVVYVLLFLFWVTWHQVIPGGTPSPQSLPCFSAPGCFFLLLSDFWPCHVWLPRGWHSPHGEGTTQLTGFTPAAAPPSL